MAYFDVIGFLTDEELFQVWDICAEALERKGWDCDNAELSIRAFDDNLKKNCMSEKSVDRQCDNNISGTA